MRLFGALLLVMMAAQVRGQIVNTATMDTLETTVIGRLGIGGYVDSYWGYHRSRPSSGDVSYFVSSARHNEATINLAYVDVRYRAKNLRARVVPAFGTYMNANYSNEPGTLRNLLEANVGVLLSEKRKIWIDVGVLGSPYTNESAISKDHLMYTRSLAPEHVPYYLSGVKLSVPLNAKWNSYWYLLNGWQVIQDNNEKKAVGSQIEFRPNPRMLFNWNTFVGDERSTTNPDFRTRLFTDLFWIYKPSDRWDATACIFVGQQNRRVGAAQTWWQANAIGRYAVSQQVSLSARIEYFNDASLVVAQRLFADRAFTAWSGGLCLNFRVHDQALFRLEGRQFYSPDQSLPNENGLPSSQATWAVASLTAWF